MDTAEFIKRANKKHQFKFDYSNVVYINNRYKITIICKEHGAFEQRAKNHLEGQGCPQCKKERTSLALSGKESFILKAREKHGDIYDYTKADYKNAHTKIEIICLKHGPFQQTPNSHLKGRGCPKCGTERDFKYDIKKFSLEAEKKHQNQYRYKEFANKSVNDKIEIECPKHGIFQQSIKHHLAGHGCYKCAHGIQSIKDKIQRFVDIHGGKYDYSLLTSVKDNEKISIICKEHGEYQQTVNNHLAGHGCPICNNAGGWNRLSKEDFIEKAEIVHGQRYNYDKVEYVNYSSNVTIICENHGQFTQTPSNHLAGNGCPRCALEQSTTGRSAGQMELYEFIIKYDQAILNDRDLLNGQEVDIYCPNKKIAIEYHGMYYHSYASTETKKQRLKHYLKADLVAEKGITLIQVYESEWKYKRRIVEAILKSKLGDTTRIFARKCKAMILQRPIADEFVETYHIQGSRPASVNIGLIYNDELMSCMTFSRRQGHGIKDWELMRLCSKAGVTIVGGPSKMFKMFIRDYNPDTIFTFADRRYSTGNVYKALGFSPDGISVPGYGYTKSGKWFPRQRFQKHKLRNLLNSFDDSLTEAENMFMNGYRRIWDAGHWKFIWKKDENKID